MYNDRAQFNQTGFNGCVSVGVDSYMKAQGGVIFTGRVRSGADYVITGAASLLFTGVATPARGRKMYGSAGLAVTGTAKVTRLVGIRGTSGLTMTGVAKARIDHRGGIRPVGGITMSGKAKARIDHRGGIRPVGGLRFAGSIKLRRDVVMGESLAGVIFTGVADVRLRSEETLVLSITLAAGQIIVIDTESYTVTRNGSSIISAHSGAWPQLQRGSSGVEIVANGPTETQIIYQEQWL